MHARGDDKGRHAGEIELKKLGHLLLAYLPAIGGRVKAPRYLHVDERASTGVETCRVCGATIDLGDFTIRNLDDAVEVTLPYLAVHALVTHGDRRFHGEIHREGEIDGDLVKDILNYEEYRIGRLLTALLAHTSLVPEHLVIAEHMMRGTLGCGECGDSVNRGYVTITNIHLERSMEIPYLALHALVEHKDAHFTSFHEEGEAAPSEWMGGLVDMERLRAILGHSRAHQHLGIRIAGYLRAAGGTVEAPPHLAIVEHPGAIVEHPGAIVEHPGAASGRERCATCGAVIDGGHFEIRNVHTGHEMLLSYLAVHALVAHGDAYHRGARTRGWVDVPLLQRLTKRTWPVVQRLGVRRGE